MWKLWSCPRLLQQPRCRRGSQAEDAAPAVSNAEGQLSGLASCCSRRRPCRSSHGPHAKATGAPSAAGPGLATTSGSLLNMVLDTCGLSGAGKLASACHGLHCEVFLATNRWELALSGRELLLRAHTELALRKGEAPRGDGADGARARWELAFLVEPLLRVHAELAPRPPEPRAAAAAAAEAPAEGGAARAAEVGLSFCERFMEHFVARNRLQEFVLRSMEDFVVWLRRIARFDDHVTASGGGSVASAAVALRVVQRRLARVLQAEALVKAGLAESVRVLHIMQDRCRAASTARGTDAPDRVVQNLQQLTANLARLEANVESFVSVAMRCGNLAVELAAEAESLEGRLLSVVAAAAKRRTAPSSTCAACRSRRHNTKSKRAR